MSLEIKGGLIFDGKKEDLIKNPGLFIDKGKIQQVPGEKSRIIDASDGFIMPGLIDSHVHLIWDARPDPEAYITGKPEAFIGLLAARQAQKILSYGITTVRDTGSEGDTVLSLRRAVEEGVILGPNIVCSGPPLAITGGHINRIAIEVDGVEEVRKAARWLLKRGVDFIKVMATGGVYTEGEEPGSPQFTIEEMVVVVEEAHKQGKKVSAHAQGLTGIRNAIEAGIDTIEHGYYADEGCWEKMIAQGTYLVPVITCPSRFSGQTARDAGVPLFAIKKAEVILEAQKKSFKEAVTAGVKIATGTDVGAPMTPPSDYFIELGKMVEAGMSIFEVLLASTSIAADAIGLDSVGVIEPGKQGDLIVLDGDPLEDLGNLRKIRYIIKSGEIVLDSSKGPGLVNNINKKS